MSKKPKFEEFYQEEWPYDQSEGVGLSFYGVPNDYKKFLDILMQASCNPVSARRILNVLERNETKYVTVMFGLNFNIIGNELKKIGVVMKITAPFNYPNPTDIDDNSIIDSAVLSFIKDEKYKVDIDPKFEDTFKERLKETQESISFKPHNFGPY